MKSAEDKGELIIVTGLSGAGKTQAMKGLEDLGFFCIDNLPPMLLPQLVDLHLTDDEIGRRFAVAMDVRGQEYFRHMFEALDWLKERDCPHQIVFLEASDTVLVRRFSETRRRHPLEKQGNLYEAIARERELLAEVKFRADVVIDTSVLKPAELKAMLSERLIGLPLTRSLNVEVVSFGYKYGVPMDADIVFDVRFLPNPFYTPELRDLTGLDQPVSEYVFGYPQTGQFVSDFHGLLSKLIPAYGEEGKARLTVAIGCTGGQHRSVAIAEEMGRLLEDEGYDVGIRHRDIVHAGVNSGVSGEPAAPASGASPLG